MKRILYCVVAMLFVAYQLRAQHTFSIVAVDPVTGEVGSAGASCVPFDVAIISDLAPGIGAINSQAYYIPNNQTYAGFLLRDLVAPAVIIDSLIANDIQGTPELRQYGIATLADAGTTAAHTGDSTNDYKGHRLGRTYAVQGNILLGSDIIDSIALRFERSTGRLEDRLMYALLGARVVGADSRCTPYGTSSLGAYLRVARPGDREDSIFVDLRASIPAGTLEPLDSLETLFNAWKGSASADLERTVTSVSVVGGGDGTFTLDLQLARPADVSVDIYSLLGQRVGGSARVPLRPGHHNVRIAVPTIDDSSLLFARITCDDAVITRVIRKSHD